MLFSNLFVLNLWDASPTMYNCWYLHSVSFYVKTLCFKLKTFILKLEAQLLSALLLCLYSLVVSQWLLRTFDCSHQKLCSNTQPIRLPVSADELPVPGECIWTWCHSSLPLSFQAFCRISCVYYAGSNGPGYVGGLNLSSLCHRLYILHQQYMWKAFSSPTCGVYLLKSLLNSWLVPQFFICCKQNFNLRLSTFTF